MRLLRLADTKTPAMAMDKLEFYVLQADHMLPWYLDKEERLGNGLLSEDVRTVLKATNDTASIDCDDEDDNDDNDDDIVEEAADEAEVEAEADEDGSELSDDSDFGMCMNVQVTLCTFCF